GVRGMQVARFESHTRRAAPERVRPFAVPRPRQNARGAVRRQEPARPRPYNRPTTRHRAAAGGTTMSDEQPTSWRDRFVGSGPAQQPPPEAPETAPPTPSGSAAEDGSQHSAERAPDEAEVAATSVDEHDAHQPLVEHDTDETRVE